MSKIGHASLLVRRCVLEREPVAGARVLPYRQPWASQHLVFG
jgi:hypothetical protein